MQNTRVGTREFQKNLTSYLSASKPVPARRRLGKEAVDALLRAGEEVNAALKAAGVTEEELVEDFEEMRRQRRKSPE